MLLYYLGNYIPLVCRVQVDAATIDGTVLTTIQMICDSVQDNHLLSVQIHQYLIFDFRLWTRSEASVQIGK